MTPLPVVTDAWQAVTHTTAPSGELSENVYGFVKASGALDQAAADALAGAIADAYGMMLLSNQYSLNSITVTDLRTVDGPQFESIEHMPKVGPQESQPLPLQTASLVTWYTARRGRSFRGRTYIAGWTEGGSDGAHMQSSDHTSFANFCDAMLAIDPPLGIISRYEPNPSPPPSSVLRNPGIITQVTSRVVHDLWATQRKRAPRG
jgi:hypothetical protein